MSVTLDPFALERYFARYEFSTRYLLCSSDAQTMPVRDLLALEPGSMQRLGDLSLGYTESRGSPALRQSIASLYEHGDAEAILVHAGSEEAIFAFANVVLARGDQFIVQFPCYQSHYSVAQAIGAELLRWHSDLAREGMPDLEELERLVTPATRAIVLTTPNNPTGYAFDRREIERRCRRSLARTASGSLAMRSTAVSNARPSEFRRFAISTNVAFRSAAFRRRTVWRGCGSVGSQPATQRSTRRLRLLKITSRSATAGRASFSPSSRLPIEEYLLERVRRIVARNLDCLDEILRASRGSLRVDAAARRDDRFSAVFGRQQ